MLLRCSSWSPDWDHTNDWSAEDLTTTGWVETEYINLYGSEGILIYGYPGEIKIKRLIKLSFSTAECWI